LEGKYFSSSRKLSFAEVKGTHRERNLKNRQNTNNHEMMFLKIMTRHKNLTQKTDLD